MVTRQVLPIRKIAQGARLAIGTDGHLNKEANLLGRGCFLFQEFISDSFPDPANPRERSGGESRGVFKEGLVRFKLDFRTRIVRREPIRILYFQLGNGRQVAPGLRVAIIAADHMTTRNSFV